MTLSRELLNKNRNIKQQWRKIARVTKFLILACFLVLCSCAAVKYFKPEESLYDEQLSKSYRQIKLKETSSADMLAQIYLTEDELLSRSKSVIALLGQKGYRTWFNMAAFGGMELTAQRKHFFIVNDRPRSLQFDCEMVLESEVFGDLYVDENAKRIAMLKQVMENVRRDINEVGQDNKMFNICGMVINQTLRAILVKLGDLPMLASRLSEKSGLEFNHINLDKGKIRMVVDGDVVTVKMRLGALVRRFEEVEDVNNAEQTLKIND